MRKVILVAISFTIIFSNELSAYDATAHKRLARIALQKSILANADFMESLGIDELSIAVDEKSDEECADILRANNQFDPLEQFYCGAYQEDYPLTRTLNHFFDPVNERGLIPLITNTAADWALEDTLAYTGANIQDHSNKDAIEYFFQGYTDLTKPERLGKLKQFFQVLGQVAHMVEDMASPEHVRIDQHLYPSSEYEHYVGANIKSLPEASFQYQSLDLNIMETARHFFSNRLDMVGLADFTNSNFISIDTNFIQLRNGDLAPGPKYQLPQPNQALVTVNAATELGQQYHGVIKFISSDGYDGYAAAAGQDPHFRNDKASVLNLYYEDLYNHIIGQNIKIHHLGTGINDSTMKAAHGHLLRRATSYSTGFVNYFFRGHVEISNVISFVDDLGFPRFTFKIKNTTSEHNSGATAFSFSDGDFDLYYDTENGERKLAQPIISAGINNSLSEFDSLHDQDEITVEYQLREAAWDQKEPFTLVFKGSIGSEEGVMAKIIEPPRLFSFVIDGVTGNSPVDNTIKIYSSADLGFTWSPFREFSFNIEDTSISDQNSVHIFNAVYLGSGEMLLDIIYNDHLDDNGNITSVSHHMMFKGVDYGRTWNPVSFDWSPLLVGMDPYNRISELKAIHESLVFTGNQNLSAIRLQHPDPNDPPLTPRSFQLLHTDITGSAMGNWSASTGFGQGGLPEIDYLGDISYVFSSILHGQESGAVSDEGGGFRNDTILTRTDDGGITYYPLSDIKSDCGDPEDPANEVYECKQNLTYIGNNRLIGWTTLKAHRLNSYLSYVPLYLSDNGGMRWDLNRVAPFSRDCSAMQSSELSLDELIYIGKIDTQQDNNDVLVSISSCVEIYEADDRIHYPGNIVNGLFSTRDGGANWNYGELPTGYTKGEVQLLFVGDNGAIPGIYGPDN